MAKYLIFGFLFLAIQSFAQVVPENDSTIIALPQVVVASDYRANAKTPISFQNLSVEKIEYKNTGQEPSFLLSETPSITVYSDAGSYQGYSYIRLRGIDQTRINMTLDGVPLNEPEDQGVYFSNYPDFLRSLDAVQIQRGVGLSQNGNASYGGSLQFSSPSLYQPQQTQFGLGYGSYNSYNAFGTYNSGVKNNKAIYLRASHIHSDGYKNRSANTSSSIFYRAGLFGNDSNLKLTGFVGTQKNQMAWLGISQDQIDEDPRTNANAQEDDQFTQSLTQLQHHWSLGRNAILKTSLYYNYLEGDYDFDLNNFLGFPSTEELYNYAFKSHFFGGFSNYTLERNNLSWTVGIHANTYQRQHTGSERTIGELYTNTGFKNEISLFTKAQFDLGRLTLFSDIQFRSTKFTYEGSVPYSGESWSFLNPKVGLNFQLNTNSQLYYSVGRTGREPTRNDIFGGSDDLLADSLGLPLLFITDPEFVTDHELGIRFGSDDMICHFNLYHMRFQNEIVLNGQFGPNGLALNSNVAKSTRSGAELHLVYQAKSWLKLTNSSSLNYSQIKEEDISFRPILTPAFISNQEFTFNFQKFETSLSFRYQSSSFIDFANENELDNYFLSNWRGTYVGKKWKLSVLFNNLTNIRYFNNGYVDFDGTNKYFVQAPRNIYFMLTYAL